MILTHTQLKNAQEAMLTNGHRPKDWEDRGEHVLFRLSPLTAGAFNRLYLRMVRAGFHLERAHADDYFRMFVVMPHAHSNCVVHIADRLNPHRRILRPAIKVPGASPIRIAIHSYYEKSKAKYGFTPTAVSCGMSLGLSFGTKSPAIACVNWLWANLPSEGKDLFRENLSSQALSSAIKGHPATFNVLHYAMKIVQTYSAKEIPGLKMPEDWQAPQEKASA